MRTDFEMQGEVTREIRNALAQMGARDAEKVWVEATEGIVVSNGLLKTWEERERAQQATRNARAFAPIYNDIRMAA